MILKDKVAVVYGAGGAIGSAVARAFAEEGATLFLTGRARASVGNVANDIAAAGFHAEVAEVDALSERAVGAHLQSVVDTAGRIDISFDAVGFPDVGIVGVPLTDIDLDKISLPIAAYTRSFFLTARLAAKHMIPNASGVIMTVTSIPARIGTPSNGGFGAAHAAKDQLTRDFSYELAPQGIRVVALRPHGLPETTTMREIYDLKQAPNGATWEQFVTHLANWSHTHRVMTLAEVGTMAALLASDKASGMTGTTVNLTMGAVSD